jgi:hypothetical protein
LGGFQELALEIRHNQNHLISGPEDNNEKGSSGTMIILLDSYNPQKICSKNSHSSERA